jgi:hypothetical protein
MRPLYHAVCVREDQRLLGAPYGGIVAGRDDDRAGHTVAEVGEDAIDQLELTRKGHAIVRLLRS